MKKFKFILPLLAFVMAIGMSFAFVASDETFVLGYYETAPGTREPIDVNCESGSFDCTIQFVNENGDPVSSEYLVYPNETSQTPLPSPTNAPILIEIQ